MERMGSSALDAQQCVQRNITVILAPLLCKGCLTLALRRIKKTEWIKQVVVAGARLLRVRQTEKMIQVATERNPAGRLTTPQDVANAVATLSHPLAGWITGNVINVDGGEGISG